MWSEEGITESEYSREVKLPFITAACLTAQTTEKTIRRQKYKYTQTVFAPPGVGYSMAVLFLWTPDRSVRAIPA